MDSCIGKTYDEITKIFTAKHGTSAPILALDMKWREIGKLIAAGRK